MSTSLFFDTFAKVRADVYRTQHSLSVQQGLVANDHRSILYRALERVVELHPETLLAHYDRAGRRIKAGQCAECAVEWPCPTIEALTGPDPES